MEDAVQRINKKVAEAELRNSRTSGFAETEISFGRGLNRFNFKSPTESSCIEVQSPEKKDLSVIFEPAFKETNSVRISLFDSPKTTNRAVSITDESALS